MSDSELDNWHDYRVVSRKEILALLRQIGEKNQLVRMLINGEADVCVTSILDLDPDEDLMVLDRSIDRDQHRRVLAAQRLSCETSLDKIRILFKAENPREIEFEGAIAIAADIPESMVRLQRREFYRMQMPVTNPVNLVLPLPDQLGGGSATVPLADISCGGIAFMDNKLALGQLAIGTTFDGCRLDLPEIGPVVTSLEIRNVQEVTLLNNKSARRFGCMFTSISRGNLANVQKYITKLERERNARLAGLS